MKNLIKNTALSMFLVLGTIGTNFGQGLGLNNPTPDASSILDLTATNRGLLVPRMTTSQKTSITSPATGLLVFDTDLGDFHFYDGTGWIPVGSTAANWTKSGNYVYNTTDSIGIGTAAPGAELHIVGRIWQTGTGQSVFLGEEAGANDDLTSNQNVFVGYQAGNSTTNGILNTAIGYQALFTNTIGNRNTASGSNALYSNYGDNNTANGYYALYGNTNGDNNSAIGSWALFTNTNGINNTAFGRNAIYSNLLGDGNTASGYYALSDMVDGSYNVAYGLQTLGNNTIGSYNTAVGVYALLSNQQGDNATAIGYGAMRYANNTTTAFINFNVALGYEALRGSTIAANNTGNSNTGLGYQTLMNYTSGGNNTAVGYTAGNIITTGTDNTFIGYNADATVATLTNATAIGANASVSQSNSLILGSGADVGMGTSSPQAKLDVRIADLSTNFHKENYADLILMDTENTLQIVGDNGGNNVANLVFTSRPSTGNNKHWSVSHRGPSSSNRFSILYGNTTGAFYAFNTLTEMLVIDTTGRVGIGTISPSEILEVAGTAQMTGFKLTTTPTAGYVLTSDASGIGTWTDPTTISDGDWTVSGSDVYSAVSGSVGIGDATPDGKLEVRQTAAADIFNLYDNTINVFSVLDGGDMWAGSPTTFYVDSSTNRVGIGTTSPEFKLSLESDGGIIAKGAVFSGVTMTTAGSGTRMIWYPRKAAFRAGHVNGTQWDDANIGNYSGAIGNDLTVSGPYSFAAGVSNVVSSSYSVAFGQSNTSSNDYTFVGGQQSVASGSRAFAYGYLSTASGNESFALGTYSTASAQGAMVLGFGVSNASRIVNSSAKSLMVGFNSDIPTLFVGTSAGVGTTGNVGIGTTSPGAKLEVAGQVKITGGSPGADKVLTSDAAGLATWEPSVAKSVAVSHNTTATVWTHPDYAISFSWNTTTSEITVTNSTGAYWDVCIIGYEGTPISNPEDVCNDVSGSGGTLTLDLNNTTGGNEIGFKITAHSESTSTQQGFIADFSGWNASLNGLIWYY